MVSHVGSRLLADLADVTTLTAELVGAVAAPGRRRRHEPGRVLVDLAVAIADGAEVMSDIDVIGHQRELFGAVASDSTVWRVLNRLDEAAVGRVAAARAAAREVAWAQHAEVRGRAFPLARAAGRAITRGGRGVLVIDLDATIVLAHSEKDQARATFKGTFGFHPMLAFCDNTGEFLTARLRAGNAGANNAADHITVLDAALAQVPDAHRHGTPILVRCDTAGGTKAFLAHVRAQRDHDVATQFSVGWRISDRERTAITTINTVAVAALGEDRVWQAVIDAAPARRGQVREGAGLVEITDLLPDTVMSEYPAGTRVIVRRERPHPGAQLSVFEETDGWRYTAFATDTPAGPDGALAHLDARHRAHARVEDRIRTAKDTGLARFPSHQVTINTAWLTTVMIAADLLAWTQLLLLDGPLAVAEPKTLRYRLLHVAARLTRSARRVVIRLDHAWPFARELLTAFTRLAALPTPA